MKRSSFNYYCFSICLYIFGCQKKELPQNNDQKVVPKLNQQQRSIPIPDSNTFFPLINGSYWIYETIENGETVDGTRMTDSVIAFAIADNWYIANVQQKGLSGDILNIQYKVGQNGKVLSNREDSTTFELFTSLNPSIGMQIKNTTFFQCPVIDSLNPNCFLLQPYPGDKNGLTEVEKGSWTGCFFEKGIGLVSNAGVEISQDLVEYRIGLNGPKIKLK